MSMTREEAIKEQESLLAYWESGEAMVTKRAVDALRWSIEALYALRPVIREQVEKVWRGCEKCNGAGEYSRYAENLTKTLLAKYCPHCGRPLTDEAMQMVMERMEALYGKAD